MHIFYLVFVLFSLSLSLPSTVDLLLTGIFCVSRRRFCIFVPSMQHNNARLMDCTLLPGDLLTDFSLFLCKVESNFFFAF